MIIPPPRYEEPAVVVPTTDTKRDEYIKWFLNVPSWKCTKCGAVMFGRMDYCVYCKMRLGIHTPREGNSIVMDDGDFVK